MTNTQKVKPFIMGDGNDDDFNARNAGDRRRIGNAIEQGLARRSGSCGISGGSLNQGSPHDVKHRHKFEGVLFR